MVITLLLPFTAVLPGAQSHSEVVVCIGNPLAADRWLVEEWRQELGRIVESSGRELRIADCDEPGAMQVYFMRIHPFENSALGAARTRGEVVLPLLELYTEPVAAMLGTRLPGVLGRALARVTAHEMAHYLRQETHHEAAGAFAAQYTAGLLRAARPAYFALR
ncbi:MAG: hypothetical protein IPJ98_15665 [Bryobacterales bacterium]|nr:hypothetical protein [Bryobacterales bacterium]